MFHTRENSILKFNLDQGKDILTYNDDMDKIVTPHLKLIQSSTLIEGLNGENMSYNDKKALEGLQNIENQFIDTIFQCITIIHLKNFLHFLIIYVHMCCYYRYSCIFAV